MLNYRSVAVVLGNFQRQKKAFQSNMPEKIASIQAGVGIDRFPICSYVEEDNCILNIPMP